MIDARELRIGNWVNEYMMVVAMMYKYGSLEYEVHLQKVGTLFIYKYLDKDLEPIPLTTGILIGCGFEREMNKEKYPNSVDTIVLPINLPEFKKNTFKSIFLSFDNECIDFVYIHNTNDNTVDDSTKLPHIKYVHQLQNLIYALTQKELEIKL